MKVRVAFAAACGLFASQAYADFSGVGELGVVVARGNSESETANARLEVNYSRDRWANESIFNVVHARDAGTTSSSRFVISNNTNYDLNERSYLVGALRYDRDRFSSFRYQGTVSLGYGRRLIDNETHRLRVELGPGFRFAEVRDTEETDNEMIARGFIGYRWRISETATFTNRFLVESGVDNTFAENSIGLTLAVNSRISMKTGFAVRHNTDVEPGRKRTDTLTTVNLVYNFGESD